MINWRLNWFWDRLHGREETFKFINRICWDCETVLDVGGGVGFLSGYLDKQKLTVVDFYANAILWGKSMYPRAEFIMGTIDDAPGSYDAVTCLATIENMPYYTDFLTQAWTKARKLVVFTLFNGFRARDRIRPNRTGDYWNNSYSRHRMVSWIRGTLAPSHVSVKEIKVDRGYGHETVITLYKRNSDG